MQATGQQMSAGANYSSSTRIGNWYEEICLEEAKVSDFQKRSETGSLHLRRLESKLEKCSQVVPHSFSSDGYIRFGDTIMLSNVETEKVLSCDPFEQLEVGIPKFLVTAGPDKGPLARSIFKVVRPLPNQSNLMDDNEDPILRYGQAFLLQCDDALLVSGETSSMLSPPLYLASTVKNERTATKATNRQMCFMTSAATSDAVWTISRPSQGRIGAADRFLAEGSAIQAADMFLLVHRQTNNYLATDNKRYERTDFGPEVEVYCDRTSAFGKLGLITAEFKGECTSQTLSKPDSTKYYWAFLTAVNESSSESTRELPPPLSPELLLKQIADFAISRGAEGWLGLRSQLAFIDRNSSIGDGMIDKEDIKDCFGRWGVDLQGDYLDLIFDKGTVLNYKTFIASLRGPLSENRTTFLENLFDGLSADTNGIIPLDIFTKQMNLEMHPLVYFGSYEISDLVDHLGDVFAPTGKDLTGINKSAFVDYFSDIGTVLEDDEYFEGTIRNILNVV